MDFNNQCTGEKIEMPNTLEPSSEPVTVSDAKDESGIENKTSSLSAIALEYYSNSDVEEVEIDTNKTDVEKIEADTKKTDVEEIQVDTNKIENQNTVAISEKQTLQQYRTIEENVSSSEEIDSEDDSTSSCTSTSSSSTDSDNSSSDSDVDEIVNTNNNRKKRENKGNSKKKKEIENEFDNLPPIEDLKISVPEVLCEQLGEIDKIVEQLVIVKPKPGKPTLQIDTVLFVERGKRALGHILDVFGPVSEPNYCIRFNSSEHIQESNIKVGMLVYYCPTKYTSFIFPHELHKMKSYDAVGDDEPPVFSDDEEEQAYYEALKQKNNKDSSNGNPIRKRQRTSSSIQNRPATEQQSNNPWNKNGNLPRKRHERKQAFKNNSHFNQSQYGPYCYNNPWLQYQNQYQSNMHWPPAPRHMPPRFNGPSFNELGLPQYGNYNSNSSSDPKQYFQGTTSNSQSNNMQSQYPRVPFGGPPRFNPMLPSFPSYPQYPNTFSYLPYSTSGQPPVHTNALWSPLPPPPPPSTESSIVNKK